MDTSTAHLILFNQVLTERNETLKQLEQAKMRIADLEAEPKKKKNDAAIRTGQSE